MEQEVADILQHYQSSLRERSSLLETDGGSSGVAERPTQNPVSTTLPGIILDHIARFTVDLDSLFVLQSCCRSLRAAVLDKRGWRNVVVDLTKQCSNAEGRFAGYLKLFKLWAAAERIVVRQHCISLPGSVQHNVRIVWDIAA